MGTLYMIRHGQASFGSENYDRLSQKGVLQSRVVAEHLLQIGAAADAIYSGEMKRQTDTAAQTVALHRDHGNIEHVLRIDASFNEYASQDILMSFAREITGREPLSRGGIFQEYKDKKDFQTVFEKILSGWATGKYTKEGLVTWEEFSGRVWGGIENIIHEDKPGRTVLIFTSGGPISAAVQKALGLSSEQTIRLGWQIANASITKFVYKKDRFTLASFNETAHLALRKGAELITYR
jgi:broad specificity phosphatase PhoE